MFLAWVEWLLVTSRSHTVTDRQMYKISIMITIYIAYFSFVNLVQYLRLSPRALAPVSPKEELLPRLHMIFNYQYMHATKFVSYIKDIMHN